MQRNRIKKTLVELRNRESQGEKNLRLKFIRNIPKIIVQSNTQDKSPVVQNKPKTSSRNSPTVINPEPKKNFVLLSECKKLKK